VTKHPAWPKNGRALSNALRRLAPTLRAVGVDVAFDRESDQKRRRLIRLAHGTTQPPDERQTPGERRADEREQALF